MSASEPFPAELVREVRALPVAAPWHVRERVRALGEPETRRVRVSLPPLRRTLLVLAPACLVVVFGAAVVRGLTASSSGGSSAVAQQSHAKNGHRGSAPLRAVGQPTAEDSFGRARAIPTPSPLRHQNYQADLRVRVKDYDALGRETAAAMRVT